MYQALSPPPFEGPGNEASIYLAMASASFEASAHKDKSCWNDAIEFGLALSDKCAYRTTGIATIVHGVSIRGTGSISVT